jgi:hypothetical protein
MQPAVFPAFVLASMSEYRFGSKIAASCFG